MSSCGNTFHHLLIQNKKALAFSSRQDYLHIHHRIQMVFFIKHKLRRTGAQLGMETENNLWEEALDVLRDEVDPKRYDTWLKTTRFRNLDDRTLHLEVSTAFNRSVLLGEFKDQISDVVGRVADRSLDIDFHVVTGQEDVEELTDSAASLPSASNVREPASAHNLSTQFTFDNFVVGESNRFAHAACSAVAEPDTEAWNPLLLWGGSGLGKTHLLQAVGVAFLQRSPHSRVRYVNSEQFMNGFINAIQQGKMAEFRAHYRKVDLLLLDDVQFLFGKEGTQNEFFHTFNELHGSRKKIVLSSDRPPSEMQNIEERLRSRFEWGLVVDIQIPDLETRVAILHQKAIQNNFALPNDVAIYIAERINTNIRKLEGVLTSLRHHWQLTGEPISMDSVRKVLGHYIIGGEPSRINIERIQKCVCDYFDISLSELTGKERHMKVTLPRHLSMYLCRMLTDQSYPEIAISYSGRNHTSVLHAFKKIKKKLLNDANLQNITNHLAKKIEEGAV